MSNTVENRVITQSREFPGKYGKTRVTLVAFTGEDDTLLELGTHGLRANIVLTREQLAGIGVTIDELLRETER